MFFHHDPPRWFLSRQRKRPFAFERPYTFWVSHANRVYLAQNAVPPERVRSYLAFSFAPQVKHIRHEYSIFKKSCQGFLENNFYIIVMCLMMVLLGFARVQPNLHYLLIIACWVRFLIPYSGST